LNVSRSDNSVSAADLVDDRLAAEVVGLLARLIRADTSNPPGDTSSAARVLHEYFNDRGVTATLVGESPELLNCVARLTGADAGPSLLMLGHLDVVPAEATEWSEPPFSGLVKDGYVWGRGALDMKNQLATQAVTFARLARRAAAGQRLGGDLVFAATADEETGARCGAAWLLDTTPELLRADFVITEGGMDMFETGGGRLFTIHVGEKGYAACRISVGGRGGHGSVPLHRQSAIRGLADVIEALARYEPEVSAARLPADFIDRAVPDPGLRDRLKDPGSVHAALRDLADADGAVAAAIEPSLGLTFSPTIVRAGSDAVNVIPSHAEVTVDCRLMPGQTQDDIRREMARALAGVEAPWEMEVLNYMPGSESPARTPLREAIVAALAELVPDADVICGHFSGFTDSGHVRTRFPDVVAYGFCPFIVEDAAAIRPRLHGADERISVRDLVFQQRFGERLALKLLG
jgi:acetylornithine deacetylase/succinyl-diaminopimelate desuccinylase-like protein